MKHAITVTKSDLVWFLILVFQKPSILAMTISIDALNTIPNPTPTKKEGG